MQQLLTPFFAQVAYIANRVGKAAANATAATVAETTATDYLTSDGASVISDAATTAASDYLIGDGATVITDAATTAGAAAGESAGATAGASAGDAAGATAGQTAGQTAAAAELAAALYTEGVYAADTGNVALAYNAEPYQDRTITGNVTYSLPAPTGDDANKVWQLVVSFIQDPTGGRTVTLPTVKWPSGVAPVLPTAAGAISVVTFLWRPHRGTWSGFVSGMGMA